MNDKVQSVLISGHVKVTPLFVFCALPTPQAICSLYRGSPLFGEPVVRGLQQYKLFTADHRVKANGLVTRSAEGSTREHFGTHSPLVFS